MRIIAGEHKGRPLKAPRGSTTRPTTDRVKESFMNALEMARGGFVDAQVLDAFAGSGALGLEALSRGAAFCEFYEADASVMHVLKHNVSQLKLEKSSYRLMGRDVLKNLPIQGTFDVVILDPPYKITPRAIEGFLENLEQKGVLAPEALVVYEHASASIFELPSTSGALQWTSVFQKKYGDTTVDIVRKNP